MSTLYIRLPSKAAADGAEHWLALPCPFALVLQGEMIEQEGVMPLSELATLVASVRRVVLLLAASDVTLLRVKTPPLSAMKLKQALPNLVEDQLMADPAECAVVAGNLIDGLRTAAVMQRAWLEILAKIITGFGARSLIALPAQLCLPLHTESVSATIAEQGMDIELALRTGEQEGLGLPIVPESAATVAADTLATLRALVPAQAITLYVPQARVSDYQQVLRGNRTASEADSESGISVFADNWRHWIHSADKQTLNMMAGLGASGGPQINWRQWRWPMVLAFLVLFVNALGLNIDWWRLKQEANSLRTGMTQIFKSTYPKETVVLDAVAQMHKKIAESERNAGQMSPDDFGQLTGNFSEVLNANLNASKSGKNMAAVIASLEYKERTLMVHLKPDSQVSVDKMKLDLAARNLSLTVGNNNAWQIRSVK